MTVRKTLFLLTAIGVLLSACGPTPAPVPNLDLTAVYQTADASVATSVQQTVEAMPTPTLPPTQTPVPATETPAFTDTPAETPTPSVTATPAVVNTNPPFQGTLSSNQNKPDKTCLFRIENNSKIRPITISLFGVSPNGNDTYYFAYSVELVMLFQLPWGNWNYVINLGDKKTFTGAFRINNYDKTTIRIFDDRVVIVGP